MADGDKQYIQLPDGSYGEFPADMKDDDIRTAITHEYSASRRIGAGIKDIAAKAKDVAGQAWRSAITPPPPKAPGAPQETISREPSFTEKIEKMAAQGPGRMGAGTAPEYEGYTQEGRREHPILSRIGDVTRGAKEYGNMLLSLSPLIPEVEGLRTAGAAPEVVRGVETAKSMAPREPIPRAAVRTAPGFDAQAHILFGKPYGELNAEQMAEVARQAVPGPTERGGIQPVERRAPGGAPMGAPPGGVERRGATYGEAAPGFTITEPDKMGIRWAKTPGVNDVSIPPRMTDPVEIQRYVQEKQALQRGGVESLGGRGAALPAAPPPQQLTPPTEQIPLAQRPVPRMGAREIGQELERVMNAPPKKPPPQPGTPERPPPGFAPAQAETDPHKIEFPDPAVRRFVRANGPEIVRAFDRDRVQLVHDLSNVEIRQAAINNGIDLGTKHVGSKTALGPEQVSRQDLIDQMIRRGLSPEDIVEFSKPTSKAGRIKK